MKFDKERITTPVINLIVGNHEYSEEYKNRMIYNKLQRQMHSNKGETLISWHKKVFGRQSYCYFNGEFRFWVWDFHDWRVWVNNNKGIAVEVDPSFDLEQTMFILRYYWDRMGL